MLIESYADEQCKFWLLINKFNSSNFIPSM
jgi:hypothetical protein